MQIHGGGTPAVYGCRAGCPRCRRTACITLYICDAPALHTTHMLSRGTYNTSFSLLASSSQCVSRGPSREEEVLPFSSGDAIATLFRVPELEGKRDSEPWLLPAFDYLC